VTVLRFAVPWKPVGVNAQYERHPGGVHKTEAARAFHGAVATYGAKARRASRAETVEVGEVDVIITLHFSSERPDGDGPVKSVLDAMQAPNPRLNLPGASIYRNDNQVRDHLVRKRPGAARDHVEIVVGPAGQVFTLTELLEREHAA
jgi:Holliday junction resolvase RusA-like endonuclease